MPLHIVRNDITKMQTDAIVTSVNSELKAGGGVNGMIHKAAGEKLLLECKKLGSVNCGEAKITKGYNLSARYIIHTVGPVWQGGSFNEDKLLYSCYENSLKLAKKHKCESISFPLISSGNFGYPKDKALKVATNAISDFLFDNDMEVYLVVFDKTAFKISEKLFSDIAEYIDDKYTENYRDRRRELNSQVLSSSVYYESAPPPPMASIKATSAAKKPNKPKTLEEALSFIDESFTEMLLRKIKEKGMKESDCYKNANISRKLFSKIKNDKFYKPKKQTALAFAVALKLPLSETEELLKKAGFALSGSSKFDIIIEYFISRGIYDIYAINEALFAFDQNLLGYY